MKDTPILFTPENAQKVHDEKKPMTRRLTGLDKVNENPNGWTFEGQNVHEDYLFYDKRDLSELSTEADEENCVQVIKCPYGTVGDRLWVREGLKKDGQYILYRHGLPERVISKDRIYPLWKWEKDWLSPIHMPKWACRTWLELTGVRVERLQLITESDAIAEGCPFDVTSATWQFHVLWDSIHGDGAWDLNPWVFVLEYKKVQP